MLWAGGTAAHAASADSCVHHAFIQAVMDQVLEGLLCSKAHTFLLCAQLRQQRVEGLRQAQSTDGRVQLVQSAYRTRLNKTV